MMVGEFQIGIERADDKASEEHGGDPKAASPEGARAGTRSR